MGTATLSNFLSKKKPTPISYQGGKFSLGIIAS